MDKTYWTSERQQIYEWIVSQGLQSFAETYQGAVYILYERVPGYVRFVAHSARDLMNGMAPCKLGLKRQQVKYQDLVEGLRIAWAAATLPKGPEVLHRDQDLSDCRDTAVDSHVPKQIVACVHHLLGEHEKGRLRSNQTPNLFFEAFLPPRKGVNQPDAAFIKVWKGLHKWFQNACHESGKPPTLEIVQQLESKFVQFEQIVLSVADRYRNTVKRLDEILDEANG
jgi:hypothetical protein